MKQLLTIQDLSCAGKCSLTAAIPVISAAGVEPVCLPTALLSTHTAFQLPFIKPLDDCLLPIARHWKEIGLSFDCICTGYLASAAQISVVLSVADMFRRKDASYPECGSDKCPVLIVDPVMADNGKLYRGFDLEYVDAMREFCKQADIILPNLTEACLLAGVQYSEDLTELDVRRILETLCESGCTAVITGVSFENSNKSLSSIYNRVHNTEQETGNKKMTGIYGLIGRSGQFFTYSTELLPEKFHGTGDIFASAFSAAITRGLSLRDASRIACEFTSRCIRNTLYETRDKRFGVNLEETLPYLAELLASV